MTKPEARRGGGAKTSRSETVTVRLDPRLRYMAEIAAKCERRTLSSYIESAVESSLERVYLDRDHDVTVASSAKLLWFISEPARLARLNKMYPHLLDINEQRLIRAAREASKAIGGNLRVAGLDEHEQAEYEADRIRPYWDFLKSAAEDDLPMEEILNAVLEMKRDLDGGGPVTPERIDQSRAKARSEFEKKMAFIDAAEKEMLEEGR